MRVLAVLDAGQHDVAQAHGTPQRPDNPVALSGTGPIKRATCSFLNLSQDRQTLNQGDPVRAADGDRGAHLYLVGGLSQ